MVAGGKRIRRGLQAVRQTLSRAVRTTESPVQLPVPAVAAPDPYELASQRPDVDPLKPIRLLIGPANYASQGHAWAQAVAREVPGAVAANVAIVRQQGLKYQADQVVIAGVAAANKTWQQEQFDWVSNTFTHVLIEAQVPIFGQLFDEPGAQFRIGAFREVARLRDRGVQVAMISHGSDLRIPELHRATYPDSPFIPGRYPDLAALSERVRRNREELSRIDVPYFVSTPDLLEYAPPGAVWCPVVIEVGQWVSSAPVLERDRPVVVHAPTNPLLKGTELVEPVLTELHAAGQIDYVRVERVPQPELRRIVQEADIVLDQFTLGTYGVTTVEAMAAGRLVFAHVAEQNRKIIEHEAGQEIPLVATTAAEVAEGLRWALDNREDARELAARGPGFAQELHGGAKSAAVLREHFLAG